MNLSRRIEEALCDEFFRSRGRQIDGELEQIETALFLEEAFGLVITDEEITAELLGDSEAVKRYIQMKRGR